MKVLPAIIDDLIQGLLWRRKKISKLPDRVGDLIRLAVKDLTLCEANPDYTVDMGKWHYYDDERGVCEVCLAGSVIAQSLGFNKGTTSDPSIFVREINHKLNMLNFCRYFPPQLVDPDYAVLRKLFANYDKVHKSDEAFESAEYEEDPGQFKEDMLALANLMDRYDVHYIRD